MLTKAIAITSLKLKFLKDKQNYKIIDNGIRPPKNQLYKKPPMVATGSHAYGITCSRDDYALDQKLQAISVAFSDIEQASSY